MRKWFASLAVLGIASAAATAQTIPVPPTGGCGQTQQLGFDDGVPETSWKVFNPTGAGDSFNVDFDNLGQNLNVTGVAMSTWQSTNTGPIGIRYVGVFPDNLGVSSAGHTPDLNNPLSILGNLSGTVTITGAPGFGAGYCPGITGYDTPDVTLPTTGVHTAMSFLSGDSGTWLCSDLSAPKSNRSYFTSNNYSTPATAFSPNLMMRLIGTLSTPGGSAYMTINNLVDGVSFSQTATVNATLWSSAAVQPTFYLQGAFITGFPFISAPNLVLRTGWENFSTTNFANAGTVCGPVSDPSTGPCVPAGITFDFLAFYIDNDDLKKNGNGKIKQTNSVTCTITLDCQNCYPCYCFGQADDGVLDGTIWKVQNPAGSKDYFNMRVGSFIDPATGGNCGTTVTNLNAVSWDFCGTGPSWASFGLYAPNTALDSTGGTPDLANAVATATQLTMAPSAADWSYPATVYDFPDVSVSTSATLASMTNGHVAIQWASGDTCSWIGSDTDAADDASTTCGGTCSTLPGSVTYFTLNGYSTPAISFFGVLWNEKVEWF